MPDRETDTGRRDEDELIGTPPGPRSGRAIFSPTVENVAVSPLAGPSSDDCYTIPLHALEPRTELSVSERSGKRSGGC